MASWHNIESLKSLWPYILGGGALAGGMGRLAKNVVDLSDAEPTEPIAGLKPPSSASVKMPVEVSEEEAEDLKRQGIRVKIAMKKEADLWGASLAAGLGTAGLMGGWKVTDHIVDSWRKRMAKEDLKRVRSRLAKLIQDDPEAEDKGVYEVMKTAEAIYLKKTAGFGSDIASKITEIIGGATPHWLGIPIGIGGVTAAMYGWEQTKALNKFKARQKLFKKLLTERAPRTPMVELEPVVRKKKKQVAGAETGSPATQAAIV